MACTGSGVQIPSAPQILVKFLYIKEIYLQTKELISSQFLIAIIAVLQVSYVVKQLGLENFGMVTLIITLPSLIFRATHSRNSDVTLLALKKGSNVFTESIIFDFLIGLFSFSVCFLIFYSELGSYFGIKEITPVILLYLFSRIVQTFSETSKAILIFQGKMKSFSLLEFVTVLVRFLSILFLFSMNASIENYLISQTIYSLGYGLIGIYLATKYEKFESTNFDKLSKYFNRIKKSYGKLRFDQILGLIPQHFDVILLGVVSDISSVGIYKFAKKLIEPINYVVVTFNPWLQNKLKNSYETFEINTFFKQILLPLSFIISEDFVDSYVPMLILLIGFIFYLYTFWIRQYLLFNDLITFHAYGRLIYSGVFLLLSISLVGTYSSIGIAISLSSAMVLQKTYEYVIYKKKLKS